MVENKEKHHALMFARCQPPTEGHSLVFNKTKEIGDKHNGTHEVVLSKTQDAKKNPLTPEQKIKFAKHISPGVNFRAATKEEPTLLHAAKKASDSGVSHLHVVVGSDRKQEFHDLLHKYNGKEGQHNFKSITVHSAGERDPDAEGTTGISGTKMREHAKNNDVEAYKKGLPAHAHKHAGTMIKAVRKGMMLEMRTFKEYLVDTLLEQTDPDQFTQETVGKSAASIAKILEPHLKRNGIELDKPTPIKDSKSAIWSVKSSKYPDKMIVLHHQARTIGGRGINKPKDISLSFEIHNHDGSRHEPEKLNHLNTTAASSHKAAGLIYKERVK